MLPDCFLIGMMRCGTSALARHLDAHPDIYVGPGKELHFWDLKQDKGLDWYESLFAASRPDEIRCDATPFMSNFPAVRRMADQVEDPDIVVILRNPVDRTYSHYWHNRRRGREELGFWEALDKEAERTSGDQANPFAYIKKSHYVPMLENLTSSFPRERILIVDNRDLRERPQETLSVVFDHIGADPAVYNIASKQRRANATMSQRMRRRFRQKSSRGGVDYPPLDEESRRRLLVDLEPATSATEEWLGVPLPHWRV